MLTYFVSYYYFIVFCIAYQGSAANGVKFVDHSSCLAAGSEGSEGNGQRAAASLTLAAPISGRCQRRMHFDATDNLTVCY